MELIGNELQKKYLITMQDAMKEMETTQYFDATTSSFERQDNGKNASHIDFAFDRDRAAVDLGNPLCY